MSLEEDLAKLEEARRELGRALLASPAGRVLTRLVRWIGGDR